MPEAVRTGGAGILKAMTAVVDFEAGLADVRGKTEALGKPLQPASPMPMESTEINRRAATGTEVGV